MSDAVAAANGVTFRLERFDWAAPDRLEIAGSFVGIDPPTGEPTLVLPGPDGVRRLTAADTGAAGDEVWSAAFLWKEPPVPFDAAELELGNGLRIALPAPGRSGETLPVRGGAPPPASDALRLQVDLLTAQEEAREAHAAHEQVVEELARTRADLEAERSRHSADAQHFKHGLAQVRDAGEQALAAAQSELAALRQRVAELDGQSQDLAALRAKFEQAASEAVEARRELERSRTQQARLHTELEHARAQLGKASAALETAQTRAGAAERLQARLDAVRRALEETD